jgi:hypothetical protein
MFLSARKQYALFLYYMQAVEFVLVLQHFSELQHYRELSHGYLADSV